jgi:hypothetical protein
MRKARKAVPIEYVSPAIGLRKFCSRSEDKIMYKQYPLQLPTKVGQLLKWDEGSTLYVPTLV